MMDDLTQALAYLTQQYDDSGQHMSHEIHAVMAAARRWDWLTIPCTTCLGARLVPAINYMTDREIPGQSMYCKVCDGRGWTIRPEAIELVAHVLYEQFYDTLDGEPFSDEDGHIAASAEKLLIVLVETGGDK